MNRFYFVPPFLLQKFFIPILRVSFHYFLRWRISGLENVKNISGGVIFALNHSSELDALMIPTALPYFSTLSPMFYVALDKSVYGWSGWRSRVYSNIFFKSWGAYPAYRGEGTYSEKLRHHLQILSDGHSLCIFPEGTMTKNGNMGPARGGGTAFLSQKSGCPIVPVLIKGTYGSTWGSFFLRRNTAAMTIGTPIFVDSDDVSQEFYKNTSADVLEIIRAIN